jgi:hypothetical protein
MNLFTLRFKNLDLEAEWVCKQISKSHVKILFGMMTTMYEEAIFGVFLWRLSTLAGIIRACDITM